MSATNPIPFSIPEMTQGTTNADYVPQNQITKVTQAEPTPAAQPAPAPQINPAAVADIGRHAALGKVASFLLGKQYDYKVDPSTGQTVQVPIPQTPGSVFRSIVTGAILGGAAAKGTVDPLTGALQGGNAEITDARAQDTKRREQAQQQFQNQETVQRLQMEKQSQNRADQEFEQRKVEFSAQQAHWEIENLRNERDANLRTLEFNQRLNESNQNIEDHIIESGGYLAPWTENGRVGNGPDAMKAVNSNNPNLTAPKGYIRQVVKTTDLNGVSYDAKKGYIDQQGNPVDLSTRDKWSVYFTPVNSMKQVSMVTGKQLMKSYPHVYGKSLDPDKEYPISLNEQTTIATKEVEASRIEETEALARKKADLQVAYDAAQTDYKDLTDQLKGLDPLTDKAEIDRIHSDMEKARQRMDAVAGALNPELRKYFPVPASVTEGGTNVPSGTQQEETFGGHPVAKSSEQQAAINDKKQTALDAAGPYGSVTVTFKEGTRAIFTKEIPISQARQFAKDAGMTEQQYFDLATKNGHTIVQDPADSSDMITVQIPGNPPGQIPANQWSKFKADNPSAIKIGK